MKIRFEWQAADGYVGGRRPQHTTFSSDDISSGDTIDEVMGYLSDSIQEDFGQKVHPSYSTEELKSVAEKLLAAAKGDEDAG